ncbi:MAG: Hsp33 family molecular chaperone HslO [Rhodobacteraceae bacterium]|jgi:molecular chaperone Hsp33|nr:Hsp33 family molecular chaperone HslO [Paracoccaceae bacterium]MBL4557518.1 Hsp33 family molecular chaperone HslO [Paracoccaceae bacterium]HBG99425.1 molecular chaperone Hsp33 [Paracoccaceae bacterium]
MTLAEKIAWDDMVLPFQLDRSDIRGRVVRLDGVLDAVLAQHAYPAAVEALVAETALLTAMIGQTIKLRWKLSLQVRGDGPIRVIATDYFAPETPGAAARMRAWAGFDADRVAGNGPGFDQLGRGYVALMLDQGPGSTPYQGITPLAGRSLADCAAAYFAQSEQLPTRFALSAGRASAPGGEESWRAGGLMLQMMPAAPPRAGGSGPGADGLTAAHDLLSTDEAEGWNRANMLLGTVEAMELVGPHVSPADLLVRLFHQEAPRVFDAQPVAFGCTCSEAKVRQSLSIYSDRDIATMTTEAGVVTADCQFCGAHYRLDPATLGQSAETPDDDG